MIKDNEEEIFQAVKQDLGQGPFAISLADVSRWLYGNRCVANLADSCSSIRSTTRWTLPSSVFLLG